jgi:isoquinoline 1-oxidoreductase beta subunit
VPAAEITVRDGVVSHAASKRRRASANWPRRPRRKRCRASVALKEAKDFRLVGKHAPRKDSADKTNGKAMFTQDISLPGMLVAVVAHPPRFGATVRGFDAAAAKRVKGVVDVVQIPSGVAVLARDTWSAKKGRDALSVDWDESRAFKLGSDEPSWRAIANWRSSRAWWRTRRAIRSKAFAAAAKVVRPATTFPTSPMRRWSR